MRSSAKTNQKAWNQAAAIHILVVENNQKNRLLLQMLLEGAGFQERMAGNAVAAGGGLSCWRTHFIWMD